jgi:phosphoserine phosphatase
VASSQKLILLDMDSTFIQQEVIDLLANHAGVGREVSAITERSMRGEIDFKESLTQRVVLLAGLPERIFDDVREEISLSIGAQEMVAGLHSAGHLVAIVSGGFENVIAPLLVQEKIDFFKANHLEVLDGKLTGKTIGPIIDRQAKADYLQELAEKLDIPLIQTVAIGDGANDLGMMEIAGLSIAFNAKPVVREFAKARIDDGNLARVLELIASDY